MKRLYSNSKAPKNSPFRKAMEKHQQEKKTLFIRYSNGEWGTPRSDISVIQKCCEDHNKELRRAKKFVEDAKHPRALAPIQTNLLEFFPLDKRQRLLVKWCVKHNKRIADISSAKHRKSVLQAYPTLKRKANGEYMPVDPSDELLSEWCVKHNKKLHKYEKIIEKAMDCEMPFPIYMDDNGYLHVQNKRSKKLIQMCESYNKSIEKQS